MIVRFYITNDVCLLSTNITNSGDPIVLMC